MEVAIKATSWTFRVAYQENREEGPHPHVSTRIMGLEEFKLAFETEDQIATTIYNAVHGGIALAGKPLAEDYCAEFVVTLREGDPSKLKELDDLVQSAVKLIRNID